jgi:hypothetical protein
VCSVLWNHRDLFKPPQGRRSAVARLVACSGSGSKRVSSGTLPPPWAALLAQLTAAAHLRMRLDAIAAEAVSLGNGDPLLQVIRANLAA